MMRIVDGDLADQAGVIGLIRQDFARVGLEADQHDRDRVSSDQGFLIGRLGCDRSDQGQLSTSRTRTYKASTRTCQQNTHAVPEYSPSRMTKN